MVQVYLCNFVSQPKIPGSTPSLSEGSTVLKRENCRFSCGFCSLNLCSLSLVKTDDFCGFLEFFSLVLRFLCRFCQFAAKNRSRTANRAEPSVCGSANRKSNHFRQTAHHSFRSSNNSSDVYLLAALLS